MTAEQALSRLQSLCSRSEKCIFDISQKLRDWNISPTDEKIIIAKLQEQKFIDEQRFACAFVRDKSRLSHWGIAKIKQALQAKKISATIISTALQEIDMENYKKDLIALVARKNISLKAKNPADRKAKLLRFALSRGYDYQLSYEVVTKLTH